MSKLEGWKPGKRMDVNLVEDLTNWFINYEGRCKSTITSVLNTLMRKGIYSLDDLRYVIEEKPFEHEGKWWFNIKGLGSDLALCLENYINFIDGNPVEIDQEIKELRDRLNEIKAELNLKLDQKRGMRLEERG